MKIKEVFHFLSFYANVILMKVILTQNVPALGQKDDVKNVRPGYWRNFLLPAKLAILATKNLEDAAVKRRGQREKAAEEKNNEIEEIVGSLRDETIIIEAKADEKGNLFAGITAKKISDNIKKAAKKEIPPEYIKTKPIKKVGLYEIPIGKSVLKIEIKSTKE